MFFPAKSAEEEEQEVEEEPLEKQAAEEGAQKGQKVPQQQNLGAFARKLKASVGDTKNFICVGKYLYE